MTRSEVPLRDLVEVCSFCGAPCLGTYRFWFVGELGGDGVEVDQPTLDRALDEVLSRHGAAGYATLPDFVRRLNEDRFPGSGPVVVDADDLASTLALLGATVCASDSEHLRHVLNQLRSVVASARAGGATLLFEDW